MQLLLALLVGVLVAAGVYLVLRRNLLRIAFGIVLLSNAVNLLVLSMGRVVRVGPPLVPLGADAPVEAYANPVPQALVLTAIVIGFGLVSFALVLTYRSFIALGSIESDELGPEDLADDAPLLAGIPGALPEAAASEVHASAPAEVAS